MTYALGQSPVGKIPLGQFALGGPEGVLATLRNFTVPVWTTTALSGSWTAAEDCDALVFVTGGGTLGGSSSTVGGGGAGATYRKFRLKKGQTISYVVPAAATGTSITNGGDATATFPDGVTITGQGGQGLNGGVGSGGDLNRRGGNGVNNANPGTAGEFGGVGGSNSGSFGSGGGAAGFSDLVAWPAGKGGDSNSTVGGFPGGGTGGGVSTGTLGQVAIVAISVDR